VLLDSLPLTDPHTRLSSQTHTLPRPCLNTLMHVPGFRGARLLRRRIGSETEFVSLTFFDDLDAVRGFAGSDYERAVVAGEARQVLIRFDGQVCHYETAVQA
jgi:heme-degrading monooxygenase HmoA